MSYAKRVTRAQSRGAKASKVFEDLETEFLSAAGEAHEVWEELQVEIDRLVELQHEAQTIGASNEARARRVRETFL